MTKGTFVYALNKLESTYVSESLYYTEKKRIFQKRWPLAVKIVAIATCIAIAFTGILSIVFNTIKVSDNTVDPSLEIGQELVIRPETSGKITTGHKIGIKCFSFYGEKKIHVDVFMSQLLLDREKETISGYPVFEVYQEVGEEIESGVVLINEKNDRFEKRFELGDLQYLVAQSINDDVFAGHQEKVTLDFSNLKPGDTATIAFSYGFYYYNDNPYNSLQPDNSWCGMHRWLYFYCGEEGISVSSNCIEDAILDYEKYAEKSVEIGHNPTEDVFCSAKDIYLKPLTNEVNKVPHGNFLANQFEIVSLSDYEEYLVSICCSDGIHIIGENEYRTVNDIVEVHYFLTDCSPYGTISVEICGINDCRNRTFKTTIYCVSGGSFDYSCANCLDCLSDYSADVKQLLESVDKAGEYGSISHNTNRSIKYIPTYNVQGYIRWTDSLGVTHPARNVTVEIREKNPLTSNSWELDTVTTNASGYYSATLYATAGGQDVFIRVKSKGLNITVKSSAGSEYQYNSDIRYDLSDGDIATISYTANNTTALGKSIGVHQAMELANRYMYSLESSYMSSLDISFPNNFYGTTCYNMNKIYVLSGDAFDWDVLEHEYGHFVADQFGLLASVGGPHAYDAVLALTRGKSVGIQLAWNEGWATYFAINLQNKMSALSMNIPNVGDESYTDTDDAWINYSVEAVDDDFLLGESGEIAVSGILYDITDPVSSSDCDEICCSNSYIWGIIKNNSCQTLSSFVTAFYNSSNTTQTKLQLGETLSHFKVAARLNDTIIGLSGSTPTFTWDGQGGHTNYQNNNFNLTFYDSLYNQILKIESITTTSQTLASNQWNQIKASGLIAYCCVEAFQTDQTEYVTTGPYYSNVITINIP